MNSISGGTSATEDYMDNEFSDLAVYSHMYGLAKIEQKNIEERQLEEVYDKLQEYKKRNVPGSRKDDFSIGVDLWTEMCNYWDLTGQYDGRALAAMTPILATQMSLSMDIKHASSLEDVREVLDEGIEGF